MARGRENVFRSGRPATGLYIILRGVVEISVAAAEGAEEIVAQVRKNAVPAQESGQLRPSMAVFPPQCTRRVLGRPDTFLARSSRGQRTSGSWA